MSETRTEEESSEEQQFITGGTHEPVDPYHTIVFFDMSRGMWMRFRCNERQAEAWPYQRFEWFKEHKVFTHPNGGRIELAANCYRYEPWMSLCAPYAWQKKTSPPGGWPKNNGKQKE